MARSPTLHDPTRRTRRPYNDTPLDIEIEIVPAAPEEREHLAILQAQALCDVLLATHAAQKHGTAPPPSARHRGSVGSADQHAAQATSSRARNHRRTTRLELRLTPTERETLQAAAGAAGQTITDLVRTTALQHARALLQTNHSPNR